jgi:hypothetical protein
MSTEEIRKAVIKKLNFNLNLSKYHSFLGLGFESILISVVGGIIFGFLVGMYPLFSTIIPFLPSPNILLFVAYAIPLTGSTHYDQRLGFLSSAFVLVTARAVQLLFEIAPYTGEYLLLAGIWSMTVIFLIGYLPGSLIATSENLWYLFKGLLKVSLIYSVAEYLVWMVGREIHLTQEALLVFPLYSIPLLLVVSTLTTFVFTNTFCPYMMIPLISSKVRGQRYCGGGNFVFKLGHPVSISKLKIQKAGKKGFKLISKLPSVTVFSCPRGGIISVYHSGEMLVRKVNQSAAERINRHLTPIILE